MGHIHAVIDTDNPYIINPTTRAIENASSFIKKVIQYDHNSERLKFECPRYIESHDMSTCNKIEIHFDNIESKTHNVNSDVHIVKDFEIDPSDENTVIFSWLIGENATQLAGTISLLIKFECWTDSKLDYRWQTAKATLVQVDDSITNEASYRETVVYVGENLDLYSNSEIVLNKKIGLIADKIYIVDITDSGGTTRTYETVGVAFERGVYLGDRNIMSEPSNTYPFLIYDFDDYNTGEPKCSIYALKEKDGTYYSDSPLDIKVIGINV